MAHETEWGVGLDSHEKMVGMKTCACGNLITITDREGGPCRQCVLQARMHHSEVPHRDRLQQTEVTRGLTLNELRELRVRITVYLDEAVRE